MMQIFQGQAEITTDQRLRIELPCPLPPGAVEVVVVVQPCATEAPRRNWDELYGLGREIWQGVDVQKYVQESREDRELPK